MAEEANLTIVINARDNAVCGIGGSGIGSSKAAVRRAKKCKDGAGLG